MTTSLPDELAAAALHVQLIRRCQRAYLHELRNGLQGVSTGIDLLTRMVSGKVPASVSPDKANEMVRRAINNYEHTVQSVMEQLVWRAEAATVFPIAGVIDNAISLLNNDALANGVSLSGIATNATERSLGIYASKDTVRLLIMTLMIRSIDLLSGLRREAKPSASDGTLAITVHAIEPQVCIQLISSSTPIESAARECIASDAWVDEAIQSLIRREGGEMTVEQGGPDTASGCITRLRFPAAMP